MSLFRNNRVRKDVLVSFPSVVIGNPTLLRHSFKNRPHLAAPFPNNMSSRGDPVTHGRDRDDVAIPMMKPATRQTPGGVSTKKGIVTARFAGLTMTGLERGASSTSGKNDD